MIFALINKLCQKCWLCQRTDILCWPRCHGNKCLWKTCVHKNKIGSGVNKNNFLWRNCNTYNNYKTMEIGKSYVRLSFVLAELLWTKKTR